MSPAPSNSNPPSSERDLGLRITIENDGFRLSRINNTVEHGDILFVNFKIPRQNWLRTTIEFHDEPNGMFVFTGERPSSVVILLQKKLSEAKTLEDIPHKVYQSPEYLQEARRSVTDDSYNLLDPTNLFNWINPLSPFYHLRWDSPSQISDHYPSHSPIDPGPSHHHHHHHHSHDVPQDSGPSNPNDPHHGHHHGHGHHGHHDQQGQAGDPFSTSGASFGGADFRGEAGHQHDAPSSGSTNDSPVEAPHSHHDSGGTSTDAAGGSNVEASAY